MSYVTCTAAATDGQPHPTQVLLTEAGTLATNTPYQPVATKAGPAGALRWQSVGTTQQPVLAKTGDDQRIDWGQAYLSAPAAVALAAGNPQALKATFAKTGALGAGAPASLQGQAQRVALAAVLNLGQAATTPAQQHVLLGYDEQSWRGPLCGATRANTTAFSVAPISSPTATAWKGPRCLGPTYTTQPLR